MSDHHAYVRTFFDADPIEDEIAQMEVQPPFLLRRERYLALGADQTVNRGVRSQDAVLYVCAFFPSTPGLNLGRVFDKILKRSCTLH